MATVWIFGDSFADVGYCANNKEDDLTWMQQVPYKLGYDCRFLAKGGTSLEYTYEQFNLIRSQIQPNDLIIIALTCINRRWFIRQNTTDNIWQLMQKEHLKQPLEYYLSYLKIDYTIYLENFLYNLESLNVTTIILPCFETIKNCLAHYKGQLYVADLCLYDLSQKEFVNNLHDTYVKKMMGVDLRACHLTRSNHQILSDKICDYIRNNTGISQSGFKDNFIDFNLIKTREFSQDELFSVHLVTGYHTHITKL